jgi:hypothetical protein
VTKKLEAMVDQRKADGVTSDAREQQRAQAVKTLKTRTNRKTKKRGSK